MLRRLACTLVALAVLAPVAQARPALKRFKDCRHLVGYAKRHAKAYVAGGPPIQIAPSGAAGAAAGGDTAASAAPTASEGAGGAGVSLTNNQEAGVFEPDVVKTDGRYVYSAIGNVLRITDIGGAAPVVVGTLPLENFDQQLLLLDGRLLIAGPSADYAGTLLRLIDVSDPTRPTELRRLTVDGRLLAERRTGSTVRVVLTSVPAGIATPDTAATDTAAAWTPRGTFARRAGGRTVTRRLAGCRTVRRPRSFSGLESLTVLTIDLDKGLDPVDTDVVMTSGETVYASAQNLYVSTHRYEPAVWERTEGATPPDERTQLHRFSLDDADNTTYRATGTVPGYVLNQFSLSEDKGVLRVATTSSPPWFTAGSTSSGVTTFDQDLKVLGSVGGLGAGERIYAVRFLGDAGYMVTFRQTDPLFTLDLADPAKPILKGELVLPGFSSYLHPIANNRLIGVGTGPDEATNRFGLQVSLFDVSDLAAPKLEQRITYDNGSSDAQYDHHAFLWWQPRNLAVLPLAQSTASSFFEGAVAFGVTPGSLTEVGRTGVGNVRRSIVIGDRLVLVGANGLYVRSLDDLGADRGSVVWSANGQGNPMAAAGDGGGTTASPPQR